MCLYAEALQCVALCGVQLPQRQLMLQLEVSRRPPCAVSVSEGCR